ncbi:ABC transporter ATP-binding protein [Tenggerimyces flavus]|uniref:ABC transporter ATP-binding protein n=1 Tax=Tenggerimyces flavus TaxID=1708749 RepID=A0ABV7YAI8_9ACTN|nr:ABC transporter ATP-binding protein [Tenggerimyces flavus]MBM7785508.1 molybdate transport system ATP-binding protein [Tenggerimyces flavus]
MSLDAHLEVDRPGFSLRLDLRIEAGEVVALLGPNGAGKTTTLRTLAGLQRVDNGHITLNGERLHDVPPDRRPVGLVFQDYLLFPHLSALENVAFGPRAHGVPRDQARTVARDWLERVGLASHALAKPRALSGGQAQRVALARALAVEPRLLLLDEPLAALDASTRPEVRADLRRHLSAYDGVCVLVTHDALDAMVLADRIVVLESGRVTQEGTPSGVARAPRTEYVARLVGLNLHRGKAAGDRVTLDGGGELTTASPAHGPVFTAFPPSAVALYPHRPEGSPRNAWPVTVAAIEQHGSVVRVRLTGRPSVLADVTPGAVADLGLIPGAAVWAVVKATEVHAYPG